MSIWKKYLSELSAERNGDKEKKWEEERGTVKEKGVKSEFKEMHNQKET